MLTVDIKQITYPPGTKELLRDLSFTAGPGSLVVLKGSNGSGKTTLLNAISGILPTHIKCDINARFEFDGLPLADIPLREKYHLLAYQMADVDTQLFFPDCLKELSFAMENMGMQPDDIDSRLRISARRFGLEEMMERDPGTLSQGQKKLLLLAMCDTLDTPLVILDEPSGGLTGESLARLREWTAHLRRSKRVVVVAEHNLDWIVDPSQSIDLDAYLG
jgi:energy-coupling factor transport system ATP-binding protein